MASADTSPAIVLPPPAAAVSLVASPSSVAEDFESGRRSVKIIFSDVDGTLLDDLQQLRPRVRDAINAAADAGVPLVIATGKSSGPWTQRVLTQLKLSLPRIHNQGLVVLDPIQGPIRTLSLATQDAIRAIRVIEAHGLTAVTYNVDRIFTSAKNEGNKYTEWLKFFGEPPVEYVASLTDFLATPEAPEVSKVVLLCEPEEADAVRASLAGALGESAELTSAIPGMVEILPPGASKGAAVMWLLDRLGIDPADAMAIGDGENDKEMLSGVGLGVAMGNAAPAAVAAADARTDTNERDGVGRAVARFVLAPRGIPAPWEVAGR